MSLKVPAFSYWFLRNQSDNKSISYVSLQLIKEIFNDLFSFCIVKRELKKKKKKKKTRLPLNSKKKILEMWEQKINVLLCLDYTWNKVQMNRQTKKQTDRQIQMDGWVDRKIHHR